VEQRRAEATIRVAVAQANLPCPLAF